MENEIEIEKKHISSIDIYNLLKNRGIVKHAIIEYSHIGYLRFSKHNFNFHCTTLIFEDVNFCSPIQFIDLDLNIKLKFINCVFNENIEFLNYNFTCCQKNIGEIIFQNCKIDGHLVIKKCVLQGGLTLNLSEIGGIEINDLTASSIMIFKTNIEYQFEIKNIKVYGGIFFQFFKMKNINLWHRNLSMECLQADILHFDNVVVEKPYFIEDIKIRCIELKNSKFLNSFHFSTKNNEQISHIDIVGCEFSNSTRFLHSGNLKTLIMQNIQIQGNTEIEISYIRRLPFHFSGLDSGFIIFKNTKVDEISISGENQKFHVNFNNVEFHQLSIKNLTNLGNINFYACLSLKNPNFCHLNDEIVLQKNVFQNENSEKIGNIKNSINIQNSNLGKTNFFDFNFDSFEEININNSTLTEITTSNVGWFDFKKLNISNPSKNEDTNKNNETDNNTNKDIKNENPKTKYLKNQREIYRQLKQATEKQGDRIQALAFQAEELKVFREELFPFGL